MSIKFLASIQGNSVFKAGAEGEAKLTLTIPASDMPNVIGVLQMNEKLLAVEIKELKEGKSR